MKKKFIIIILSDPKSTTERIILKNLTYLKNKKNNYLLIGNLNFFKNLKKYIYRINNLDNYDKKKINFFNIETNSLSKNKYINIITDFCIKMLNKKKVVALINMPLNKKILGHKFIGYTEFFSNKLGESGKESMLLFNENLSVCPLTTHVSLNKVSKLINKKKLFKTVENISLFYKKIIKKKINIKICGLNPHASKDFFDQNNEDKKILSPIVKKIKKKFKNVSGLYSADTVFLNSCKSVIIGMYHDQVLPAFKALNKHSAINITLGLKILRISLDHGTGLDLLKYKKKISSESFKYAINFCEKYLNE